jgi:hypothetical protein
MSRRGKRIAFTVATMGLAVVLALGILYWRVVLDHVEAWRFQLTRDTKTIKPDPALEAQPLETRRGFNKKLTREKLVMFEQDVGTCFFDAECLFQVVANSSGCPVILHPAMSSADITLWMLTPAWMDSANADAAVGLLRSDGYRVLEQRVPRRAYVVIRDERSELELGPPGFPREGYP